MSFSKPKTDGNEGVGHNPRKKTSTPREVGLGVTLEGVGKPTGISRRQGWVDEKQDTGKRERPRAIGRRRGGEVKNGKKIKTGLTAVILFPVNQTGGGYRMKGASYSWKLHRGRRPETRGGLKRQTIESNATRTSPQTTLSQK